jgi:hypothetical protein
MRGASLSQTNEAKTTVNGQGMSVQEVLSTSIPDISGDARIPTFRNSVHGCTLHKGAALFMHRTETTVTVFEKGLLDRGMKQP